MEAMNLKLLRSGLVWLMLCIVGGSVLLFIAQQWRERVEQDHQQMQSRLAVITAQWVDANRGITHHWADRYREFAARGIVGEERRIDWIERVTRIGASVSGFRYEMAPQRRLAGVDGLDIMASRVTFWMTVPHEGRLLEILRNIEQEPSALVRYQGCGIEKIAARGLNVTCEMDWVTLKSRVTSP